MINAAVGYSIGQAVVYILKKKFKTKYKKVKSWYFFGKRKIMNI
ncbi:hypothetical protein ACQKMD_15780 [Viridibacillus sp. NPDC096237]